MMPSFRGLRRLTPFSHSRAWGTATSLLATGAIALSSAGCTSPGEYIRNGFKVGPNYKKPPAPVASEWIDSKSPGVNTSTGDLSAWWTSFNDPALNSLVEQAYRQNLDLRTAGTRILAARATRNIAVGNLFPQLQEAFADYTHNAGSGNAARASLWEWFAPARFLGDQFDDASHARGI